MTRIASATERQKRRVYYGWWVAAAACGLTGLSSLFFYGYTLFFLPLSSQLGLSRTATSTVFSLSRLGGALTSPLSGWTMDRFGPRTMMLLGVILAGVGFMALGTIVNSFLGLVLVYVLLIGLGLNLGFWQASIAAVNLWFIRRRTLAMSMMNASSNGSGFVLVPLVAFIVLHAGWRWAAIFSGALVLGVGIPLSLLVRRSPESMGLRPDGDPPTSPPPGGTTLAGGRVAGRPAPGTDADLSVGEALRTPTFWLLATGNCCRAVVWGALAVHIVPALVWKGFSQQSASYVVATLALAGMPLSLLMGWMGDRWNKRLLIVIGSLSGGAALLVLAAAQEPWQAYFFVALFVILEGTSPLAWSLMGEYFGRRRFATLTGMMSSAMSLALAVGPVFAGWVYDRTQAYTLALIPLAGSLAASAMLFSWARRPQRETQVARSPT